MLDIALGPPKRGGFYTKLGVVVINEIAIGFNTYMLGP